MVNDLALPEAQEGAHPGHFDVPVTLEDAQILGNGYECRVRLPDDEGDCQSKPFRDFRGGHFKIEPKDT
jgi:hypothetical protein